MCEHGTKTTPVFLPANGEASSSLLLSSVSLLSGGTVQPENQRERETERETHRDTETQTERVWFSFIFLYVINIIIFTIGHVTWIFIN